VKFFVPEVVQTSIMDCGPASLKAILEGHGVSASYGRLREACQTDVDGTSIDTLEDIALQLGLEAEQVMVPADHVLLDESASLPAIVVVNLPNGFNHFIVAWRRVGRWVQVMDPASGRRWVRADRFLEDIYVHQAEIPVDDLAEWIGSDDFSAALNYRLRAIGCLDTIVADGWRARAALDASLRWLTSLVHSGAIRAGREAATMLPAIYERARTQGRAAIPDAFWTAAPNGDNEMVTLRGAVLVRVPGLGAANAAMGADLARALAEPPPRPWRVLIGLLHDDGLARSAIVAATMAAVLGSVLEALLLRGAMNLGQQLGVVKERLGAVAALVGFLLLLLTLEIPTTWNAARLGRRLETRLRVAFLSKIPRLGDRYLASRPVSDMAERCHAGARVRGLPEVATTALRLVMEIAVTAVGLAWLDRASASLAIVAAMTAVLVTIAFLPSITERDMKMRTHSGALGLFYLDALLGLSPIRTHGAERAVAREHEGLLVEWARSARAIVAAYVTADLAQSLAGSLLAAALLFRYMRGGGDPSGALLLVYWALALPALGQELGVLLRQVPGHRNTLLRLLEPLGAGEEERAEAPSTSIVAATIEFRSVGVVASGHTILESIDLSIEPGEHVAIVGTSGAGKSTLFGLLLGWHRASTGELVTDATRATTAWVDPAVYLWNRPLVDNLLFGAPPNALSKLGRAIGAAELANVLEKLPDGMQTKLGEAGALVSGGEGQRVRLARGLLREDARLVLLDEPFRGLDRDRRRALMTRARTWWKDATLLCVTHDVLETTAFSRVLVVEGGRIVEDGAPADLLARESRYRAMADAETAMLREVWNPASWRSIRLEGGRLR
jgi:ATP-binding cassette subfamily B protein